MTDNDIFREMSENVEKSSSLSESEKQRLLNTLLNMRNQKINLMITGGTGVGKSSTINALFGREVSDVGTHMDSQTRDISMYELNDKVTLWDSPGLGESSERDAEHSRKIAELLHRLDDSGAYLIDLVLVIGDAASRELGTTYSLIRDVIVPNLGDENAKKTRIIAALNKCDIVMPRHWDDKNSRPDDKLKAELDDRAEGFRRKVRDETGVDIETIYYSAGQKEDGGDQDRPYNLAKLLMMILKHTPEKKRLALVDNVSKDKATWESNDKDYGDIFSDYSSDNSIWSTLFGPVGAVAAVVVGGLAYWLWGRE